MDWRSEQTVWRIQKRYHCRDRERGTNFRPPQTDLPGHRLVENRTRLLVTTETLHLSHKSPILLSNRIANHARRKQIHPRSRITLRPCGGRSLGRSRRSQVHVYFVLGCEDLTIAVDHKPLLKLFGDRSLKNIPNPRLRNLKEKTLQYKFSMTHIPGKKHRAADTISRHPTRDPMKMPLNNDVASLQSSPRLFPPRFRAYLPEETSLSAFILHSAPIQSVTWNRVRNATASDEDMFLLSSSIDHGFPDNRLDFPPSLREYFPFRDDLFTLDGVILYKERVMIPPSLRPPCCTSRGHLHELEGRSISILAGNHTWYLCCQNQLHPLQPPMTNSGKAMILNWKLCFLEYLLRSSSCYWWCNCKFFWNIRISSNLWTCFWYPKVSKSLLP